MTLTEASRLVEIDRISRRFEPERHDVVPGQQTCAQRTDFHLDKVPAIITKPNLRERRRGNDRELVVDALSHQLFGSADVENRCVPRDAQRTKLTGAERTARQRRRRGVRVEREVRRHATQ